MGNPWQDDLSPTSKPRKSMRGNTSNSYLEVAGHNLAIDGNRSSTTGLTQIGAKIEGMMVVNRKPVQNLLPQFLSEIIRCVSSVGPQRSNKSNLLVGNPGFLKSLDYVRDNFINGSRSCQIIKEDNNFFFPFANSSIGFIPIGDAKILIISSGVSFFRVAPCIGQKETDQD